MLDQLRELAMPAPPSCSSRSGRNTAPAMTLAALQRARRRRRSGAGRDAGRPDRHRRRRLRRAALRARSAAAAGGAIVDPRRPPDRPETGYGYIRARAAPTRRRCAVAALRREARPADRRALPRPGSYLWNSGMFVLRASVWLAALERFRPDIAAATRAAWDGAATTRASCGPGSAASPRCRATRSTTR